MTKSLDDLFSEVIAARNRGDTATALDKVTDLLDLDPSLAAAWNERGLFIRQMGGHFDAIMNYDRAILLSPTNAGYYCNRGEANLSRNKFDEALADFGRALHHNPRLAQAHLNRGNTFRRMVRQEDAIGAYRSAIAIRPDDVDAHLGLAFGLLEVGEFIEGWKEFEWRWKSEQLVVRGLDLPVWDGERAADVRDGLLIYAEQGYGDALQFMRYAVMVKEAWSGRVYLEVKLPLQRIAQTMAGLDGVIVLGEKPPQDVTHCVAMMSLPRILGTTVETIPGQCPYLTADDNLTGIWRKRLEIFPHGDLKIGLCWAGQNRAFNPIADAVDKARSLKLTDFALLAGVPGLSWVSLQTGGPGEQVKRPPLGMHICDMTSELYDFYDTAALMDALDLVITVDTAVAHLAGALGKEVWVLSRFDGCWRWLGNRERSPWYPSLRLFAQKDLSDWPGVMDVLERELRAWVVAKRQVRRVA